MSDKEKPKSKMKIWKWIGFYILLSFVLGLLIAAPVIGGPVCVLFVWSWNKQGKKLKDMFSNIKAHPWRIVFTVLVALAMFAKSSSMLLGILIILWLIWLYPNTEKESFVGKFKNIKSHKVRAGFSCFLLLLGGIFTAGLHSTEKEIKEHQAFVASYPTPSIQMEDIPHQGNNKEYQLEFTVKDTEEVLINGKPIPIEEDRVQHLVALNIPNVNLKVKAKNKYKESSKNIAIQREKTEAEIAAEEAEKQRQVELAKKRAEEKRKAELNSVTDSQAHIMAKNFVKPLLKAPKTAKFPMMDYSHRNLDDGQWIIQSYVDSQNSFGAMLRTQYQVKLQYNGGDWADQRNWTLLDITIQ